MNYTILLIHIKVKERRHIEIQHCTTAVLMVDYLHDISHIYYFHGNFRAVKIHYLIRNYDILKI